MIKSSCPQCNTAMKKGFADFRHKGIKFLDFFPKSDWSFIKKREYNAGKQIFNYSLPWILPFKRIKLTYLCQNCNIVTICGNHGKFLDKEIDEDIIKTNCPSCDQFMSRGYGYYFVGYYGTSKSFLWQEMFKPRFWGGFFKDKYRKKLLYYRGGRTKSGVKSAYYCDNCDVLTVFLT